MRLILDTDLSMGEVGSEIDDGFALALAVADPSLSLELVTTVRGNTDLDTVTRLTRELLRRLGARTRMVPGARTALVPRDPLPPLAGEPLADEWAPAAIARLVLDNPGEITVVAIGPLTNVALAVLLEPRVARAVKQVVVMGGHFFGQSHEHRQPGEFNFWCDPEAVNVVLASGAPVRLVGLDVTNRTRLSRDDAHELIAAGGAFSEFAGTCALAWIDRLARENPGSSDLHDSCAMHDALAVAAAIRPSLLQWQAANVRVSTADPVTRGVSMADLLHGHHAPEPNCEIARAVDADAFRELFVSRIRGLPGHE